MQQLRDALREVLVAGMHGDRGRQAHRDFLRERGSGHHRERRAGRQHLFGHFMEETAGRRIETLGRPREASALGEHRRDPAQHVAEGVAGRNHEHQLGRGDRGLEIGRQFQRCRQLGIRQVARIASRRRHRGDGGGIASPQGGAGAVARQQDGERRAPGAGAQDRHAGGRPVHRRWLRRWPRPARPRRDDASARRRAARS